MEKEAQKVKSTRQTKHPGSRHYNLQQWASVLAENSITCLFDPSCQCGPTITSCGRAGQIFIANVELEWQSISPAAYVTGQRTDGHLQLLVVRSGSMTIEHEGQRLRCGPGSLVFLEPGRHYTRSFYERTHYSVLYVAKRALDERGIRYRFVVPYHLVHESVDVDAVREILLALCSHVGSASDALLERIGEQLLDLMDVFIGSSDAAQSGQVDATLIQAKRLIERRLGDACLTRALLAKELNVSVSSLTRVFRQHGLSPMRYANSLRLERARRLLADTPGMRIQQLSAQTGFSSAAHFSRAFKKQYGLAPREYAECCQTKYAAKDEFTLRDDAVRVTKVR